MSLLRRRHFYSDAEEAFQVKWLVLLIYAYVVLIAAGLCYDRAEFETTVDRPTAHVLAEINQTITKKSAIPQADKQFNGTDNAYTTTETDSSFKPESIFCLINVINALSVDSPPASPENQKLGLLDRIWETATKFGLRELGTIAAILTLLVAIYAGARSYYEFTTNSQKNHLYNIINRLDNDRTRKNFTHVIAELSHPQNFKRPFSDFFSPHALRVDFSSIIYRINRPFRHIKQDLMWHIFLRCGQLAWLAFIFIFYIIIHYFFRLFVIRVIQLILTFIWLVCSLVISSAVGIIALPVWIMLRGDQPIRNVFKDGSRLRWFMECKEIEFLTARHVKPPDSTVNIRQMEFIDIVSKMLVSHDNWAGTIFQGIHLPGARLNGANLSDADFSRSNLTNAFLYKSQLEKINLFRTNLDMSNCSWGIFTSAYMQESSLSSATIYGANLTGINLNDADMMLGNLTGADLSLAYLNGAVMWNARLRYAKIFGADLSETKAELANFREADLSSASLSHAKLIRSDFTGANIQNADLRDADLTEADLSEADLRGANFTGATCSGAILRNAKINSGTNLYGGEINKAYFFADNNIAMAELPNHPIFGLYNTNDRDSDLWPSDEDKSKRPNEALIFNWKFLLDD